MNAPRTACTLCLCLLLAAGCVSKEVIAQRQAAEENAFKAWGTCIFRSARANARNYQDPDFVAEYSVEQCVRYRMPFVKAYMEAKDMDLVRSDKLATHMEGEFRRLARLDAIKVQQDMDAELNQAFALPLEIK